MTSSIRGSSLVLVLSTVAPVARAQSASVQAAAETIPVPSSGDAADDMTIWVHPTQPGLSLVIGTDKHAGLAVYDLAGNQRQFLADGDLNNVDLREGFPLAGGEVALVTSGERSQNVLAIYAVDPGTRTLRNVAVRAIGLGFDVYGCCMYRSAVTGDTYFFGTSQDGIVQQWRLYDAGSGRVNAARVRSFDVGGQCEGCAADDENGFLFVAEENEGIWRYGAEPGAGSARVQVDTTGPGGHLEADVEGLAIHYARGGAGYLIASSQGNSTFVVYERRPPHGHVLTFDIAANTFLGIDEVSGTDGIDVTNRSLGSAFPGGVFIAQDDSNPGANQNFKLVSWKAIAASANPPLVVDPTFDPHGAFCPKAAWAYRNGSGSNPSNLASAGLPVIGLVWESDLDCSAHSPGGSVIRGFSGPGSGIFLRAGEVLVDPSSLSLFRLAALHSSSTVRFCLPVPSDLALCGMRVTVQGGCLGSPGPQLSNAIDLILGLP